MSDRSRLLYCQEILDSGRAIQSYVDGIDLNAFVQDRMRSSVVIREFEIIGEAVGKLSSAAKEAYPEIPWQEIRDFRTLLAQILRSRSGNRLEHDS